MRPLRPLVLVRVLLPALIAPALLAAALLVASAMAVSAHPTEDEGQEDEAREDGVREDLPLPERLDRALRDMMDEVRPSLDDALDYMRSFGAIDDPRHYELPEVLPNGDIIIRRREDAPEFRPDAPDAPLPPGGRPDDLPEVPDKGIRT